jgi:beta-xylosidase
MNRIILILLSVWSSVAIAQKKKYAGNPVFEGWYADPEGIVFDNKYWIFPTYSAAYEKQVFFDAFSSDDLVKWTKHERILDTAAVKWAKKAVWAPAITEKDRKYYLFFGANDIQSDNEYGGIGVAVADQPQGPYKDHLGKPLIDKFHNGAQPIDQFVYKDGEDYYMFYGGWKHCNVVKLNADFSGFVPFEDGTIFKEVTPEHYVEGPFMFKKDGKYYFMWSEGGWTGPNYAVAYAISDSPFGPFERKGRILEQDEKIARGAGHHSVVYNKRQDKWYIIYHRRPINVTTRDARETCIDEMHFDKNGDILPVKMTFKGVKRSKLKK